jgi:hypothetical protein
MTDAEFQLTHVERWLSAVTDTDERTTIERKVAVLRGVLGTTGHKQAVRTLAQMALDVSWIIESAVIDGKFTSCEPLSDICSALHALDHLAVSSSSSSLAPRDAMIDVYGDEFCEALHWRRAALVYMYCATRMRSLGNEDADDDNDHDRQRFVDALSPCAQMIERALFEFQCMLFSRRFLWSDDEEQRAAQHDVARLSAVGVFGDVSILCLMYAGELAYWQVEFADRATATTPAPWQGLTMTPDVIPLPDHPWLPPSSLSKRERALWLLRRFLHVVREVLPAPVREAWQTARAQQLIAKLERQS